MSVLASSLRTREVSEKLAAINRSLALDPASQAPLLRALLGSSGEGTVLNHPFHCVVGRNISLDRDVFANFNTYLYDVLPISVGESTKFGPRVRVFSGCSPDAAPDGLAGDESKPVHIGLGCWFGGDVTVLSGSTVGDRVVLGAGSVVCGEIPSDCIAVGRPARPIRWVNGVEKPLPPPK